MIIIRKIARFPVKVYKFILSPILVFLLGGSCRFHPTCSQYCDEAIKRHGIVKGVYFGMLRLIRCNPLFNPGYDPVP